MPGILWSQKDLFSIPTTSSPVFYLCNIFCHFIVSLLLIGLLYPFVTVFSPHIYHLSDVFFIEYTSAYIALVSELQLYPQNDITSVLGLANPTPAKLSQLSVHLRFSAALPVLFPQPKITFLNFTSRMRSPLQDPHHALQ